MNETDVHHGFRQLVSFRTQRRLYMLQIRSGFGASLLAPNRARTSKMRYSDPRFVNLLQRMGLPQ